ncbi:porin family protein [Muribaculum intestinale]|uniref:porin family protein n=2 Tax=Muribaculum intestinale TaxID=1796646 RepID=UPI00242FE7A3|nr:porin family protein [Muribaculum intestinale]
MKRLFIALCMAAVAIFGGSRLNAQTIFDTGVPENLFRFGVRLGFNTSNLTNNYDKVMSGVEWKDNQWRGGFNAGFVVDINFRNFFAIQPGAFIYTRKNDYHLLYTDGHSLSAINGTQKANFLQIPILASLRLGVPQLVQVHIDCGPYFAWGWGGSNKYKKYDSSTGELVVTNGKQPYFGDSTFALSDRYDYGLKSGVGVLAMEHFYVGAHYQYGFRNVMKGNGQKGHNKMWTFSVGYNF